MQAPPGAGIVTVATTVALETAIARAGTDPSRGVSKEQSFLERVYRQWPIELERIAPDVLIEMGHCTVEDAVARVGAAIGQARLATSCLRAVARDRSPIRAIVRDAVAQLKEDGRIAADAEPDAIATLVDASWDGLRAQWMYDPSVDVRKNMSYLPARLGLMPESD